MYLLCSLLQKPKAAHEVYEKPTKKNIIHQQWKHCELDFERDNCPILMLIMNSTTMYHIFEVKEEPVVRRLLHNFRSVIIRS